MGANKAVTDGSFQADVLKSDKPVLVDFWAEWCGPCKKVAPVLEELSAEYAGKVEFVKLNIDENPQVTREYGVMSIPTLTVFKDGQPFQSVIGAHPKSTLAKLVESAL